MSARSTLEAEPSWETTSWWCCLCYQAHSPLRCARLLWPAGRKTTQGMAFSAAVLSAKIFPSFIIPNHMRSSSGAGWVGRGLRCEDTKQARRLQPVCCLYLSRPVCNLSQPTPPPGPVQCVAWKEKTCSGVLAALHSPGLRSLYIPTTTTNTTFLCLRPRKSIQL